jgi:hypothetical protein
LAINNDDEDDVDKKELMIIHCERVTWRETIRKLSKTMVSLRRGLSVHKLLRMLVLSGDGHETDTEAPYQVAYD